MPGIRTSTTATRPGTTRTTTTGRARSANGNDAGFTFQDLVVAYFDCRRTKRNTASALAFEQDLERNLAELHESIEDRSYQPGRSICFVITRPKPREVWAAGFRDRVVHHLLYNRIGPIFERSFVADSCACIKGRGTLYAATRMEAKIRSITQNWSRRAFYLKCDLANFFVSIDKRILFDLITRKVSDPASLWLAETILFHDPRPGAQVQGSPSKFALIPPHKSLFNQSPDFGLPIGNLGSQFFANVYLDELDQFVKHRLGCRHYVRYVDDFILLHESQQQLSAWLSEIRNFLPARLGLKLNDSKTILQPIDRGVDVVGQVVKPWRRTLRRRTFNDAMRRMGVVPDEETFTSANSYFGLLRQTSRSHADRAQLAKVVMHRGHVVDGRFTKAFRRSA